MDGEVVAAFPRKYIASSTFPPFVHDSTPIPTPPHGAKKRKKEDERRRRSRRRIPNTDRKEDNQLLEGEARGRRGGLLVAG